MALTKPQQIHVLSYNIHKGLSPLNRDSTLNAIKEMLELIAPDIVMLQEVVGEKNDTQKANNLSLISQFEFLAGQQWPHFAYGKNAIYEKGHHGNCIMSKFPISSWTNFDLSTNRFEKRGLLHARVDLPNSDGPIDLLCTHLNLLKRSRLIQISKIVDFLQTNIPSTHPTLLCGDFNDWTEVATQQLAESHDMKEAFKMAEGSHARTFPSLYPFMKLDRIYYKNLILKKVQKNHVFKKMSSDHLPLYAEFTLS